jgi:hypothetical protein
MALSARQIYCRRLRKPTQPMGGSRAKLALRQTGNPERRWRPSARPFNAPGENQFSR